MDNDLLKIPYQTFDTVGEEHFLRHAPIHMIRWYLTVTMLEHENKHLKDSLISLGASPNRHGKWRKLRK